MGLAVWLPVTCAHSFQSAFQVQNVWQLCDQLRNDESDSEDLSEAEMPCLNDGCSDLSQKQLKRKTGMQTKAKIDSISEIADPEKEAKKRKLMEDSSGDKIKAKKEKKTKKTKRNRKRKTKRIRKQKKKQKSQSMRSPKQRPSLKRKPMPGPSPAVMKAVKEAGQRRPRRDWLLPLPGYKRSMQQQ